jgi:hypothetical protein
LVKRWNWNNPKAKAKANDNNSNEIKENAYNKAISIRNKDVIPFISKNEIMQLMNIQKEKQQQKRDNEI